MKDTPSKKAALIVIIATLLWIGSGLVRSVSDERRGRRAEVMQEISSSFTPDQKIDTPYLEVPFFETYRDEKVLTTVKSESRTVQPVKAVLQGRAQVEPRSRGIFNAQTYTLALAAKETFELPPETELAPEPNHISGHVTARKPMIVVPISSKKGLKHFPSLKIPGISTPLTPEGCAQGICYQLEMAYSDLANVMKTLELTVELTGMDQISFRSDARESTFQLSSNWASPSFTGVNLPSSREVNSAGFTAEWNLVNTSPNMKEADFSVRFMEPVDVYTLTDRATKYAILFILSVFGGFFLVEVAAKLRLHPLQYALVGAALVVFYLLVISLAEHMAFGAAYGISALASISLIWFYLAAALKNRAHSNLMGGFITVLYGMLFVILSAEDFALLFGSGLTFGLLAAIMIVTRKMDWYRFEFPEKAQG